MIPLFDYTRQWRERQSAVLETIQRVLNSGQLILGAEGRAFETEVAQFLGIEHAVAVNSGTDALVLALRVLGIGAGDEVITVPNTAVPTAAAIRIVGARPVFVDIKPDELLMDPEQLSACLSPATKAIIPVHLHGLACDMKKINAFARAHDLRVVEDCAQAFGAYYDGKSVGSFSDLACFSFYPTKNLGAYGDGGLCTTADADLAADLRRQRMYGFENTAVAVVNGMNSRLDEIQAAILRLKLQHFDHDMQRRQMIAERYLNGLDESKFKLPKLSRDRIHGWHIFAIQTPFREPYRQILDAKGIRTGVHYPTPLHLMPAFQDLGYQLGDFPVAEKAAGELISLPLFPELMASEQDLVIQTLNEACP